MTMTDNKPNMVKLAAYPYTPVVASGHGTGGNLTWGLGNKIEMFTAI